MDRPPALTNAISHASYYAVGCIGRITYDAQHHATLYGRPATHRAVLLQLITHMNEHLGQQIAYARSNQVVPPWSQ